MNCGEDGKIEAGACARPGCFVAVQRMLNAPSRAGSHLACLFFGMIVGMVSAAVAYGGIISA